MASVFSDWANLPKHLLDSIFKRIVSRSDYIRSSVVCISWYCVAKHNERQYDEMSSCHHPPMLLIHSAEKGTWNLYNIVDNKVLDLQLELPDKRYCGYSKGWLIAMERPKKRLIAMGMNLVITLINPFFRVKGGKKREDSIIDLPPLREYDGVDSLMETFVTRATISADPILNADDCIVMVIYEGSRNLAFIRLTKDITWTYVDEILPGIDSIQDVVFVKDKFFAVKQGGMLFSFEITTQSISIKQLVAHKMILEDEYMTYLVVLNDKELLMVQREYTFESLNRETTKVGIFELNFDKYEWVEKRVLGDVAFFLGDNYSIFVLTSNFSRCLPNCIYFYHDYDRIVGYSEDRLHKDFGVYDVESKSFAPPAYTPNAKALMEETVEPPCWVVPTFQL